MPATSLARGLSSSLFCLLYVTQKMPGVGKEYYNYSDQLNNIGCKNCRSFFIFLFFGGVRIEQFCLKCIELVIKMYNSCGESRISLRVGLCVRQNERIGTLDPPLVNVHLICCILCRLSAFSRLNSRSCLFSSASSLL